MARTGIDYRQRGAARDRVAELLMRASAPLTTPEVAARCMLSRATAAAQLAALEREGWLARERAAERGQADRWSWQFAGNAQVA